MPVPVGYRDRTDMVERSVGRRLTLRDKRSLGMPTRKLIFEPNKYKFEIRISPPTRFCAGGTCTVSDMFEISDDLIRSECRNAWQLYKRFNLQISITATFVVLTTEKEIVKSQYIDRKVTNSNENVPERMIADAK